VTQRLGLAHIGLGYNWAVEEDVLYFFSKNERDNQTRHRFNVTCNAMQRKPSILIARKNE
jgi:hypothetical protein